jgi:lipoprotein-releasing system permease protein
MAKWRCPARQMQDRMHGILSDVIVESHSANGLPNHEAIQHRIRQVVGNDLEGMTTVVHVPAMVTIEHMNDAITRQINLIGIDTESYANVSDFSKYLMHPANQSQISFALRDQGYAPDRANFPDSGWVHRRRMAIEKKKLVEMRAAYESEVREHERLTKLEKENSAYLRGLIDSVSVNPGDTAAQNPASPPSSFVLAAPSADASETVDQGPTVAAGASPLPTPPAEYASPAVLSPASESGAATTNVPLGPSVDAVATRPEDAARIFDAEHEQHDGIVLGISIGTTRFRDEAGEVNDYFYVRPGDDVRVTFPSAGNSPTAIHKLFTVVDLYESKMSEYDSTFAFVPIERLQAARGMQGAVCSIQLRIRDGANLNHIRDSLRAEFPLELMLQVNTWRDLQGALLAAVQMETTILNILLFLIIAVAGFGILATFFMIVVEKTKDIGVLKSLGASGAGVASIFLGYGVLLGAFGAGVGAIAGLLFVANINTIADWLELLTGQEVFDPTVYYFDSIPTIVHPWMVVWVIVGAVLIAVMASVLPSIRAARMHPVEALRYE